MPPELEGVKTAEEHLAQSAAENRQSINLLWERTQCIIAVVVVFVTMGVEIFMVIIRSEKDIPTLISMAFGTVVGFYFGRTNHRRPTVNRE